MTRRAATAGLPPAARAWLAEVEGALRLAPAQDERILAELTDHLADALSAEVRAGHVPDEAAARAVARMGPAAEVAARFEAELGVAPLWLRGGLQAARLGAMVLIAAGLAGFLGEPVARRTGMDFFTGDERALAAALPAVRCAQLLRLQPAQPTCADALVEHHYGEMVEYGLVVLVIGLATLGFLGFVRRHVEPMGKRRARLDAVAGGLGALFFGAFAVSDLPAGLRGAASLAPGAGKPLLSGLVCAGVALLLAALALRSARALRRAR